MIEGAEVRTITRSQIRNKGLYEFEMEVKSFKPLSDVEGVPAVSTVDTIDAGEEGDGPATIDPDPKGGFSGIQNLGENRDGKSVMVHSEIVLDSNPTDLHENGQEDRYVVHVGIFSDVKAADRRAVRLFQKGYPASVSIGEPTRWGRYGVTVGAYPSIQEARQVGDKLRQEEGLDFWVYQWRDSLEGEHRDGESDMVKSEIVPDPNQTDPSENTLGEDRFVVHVGIFSDVKAADRRAVRLFQKGYPASVNIGGPTRWGRYGVTVGAYQSIQEARQVGDRLRQEEGLNFWIYKWRGRQKPGVGARESGDNSFGT